MKYVLHLAILCLLQSCSEHVYSSKRIQPRAAECCGCDSVRFVVFQDDIFTGGSVVCLDGTCTFHNVSFKLCTLLVLSGAKAVYRSLCSH